MFKKATKSQGRLRLAFMGPPGSGKTWTSLAVACAIAKTMGKRVAGIDSERGSMSLYAKEFDFDVCELESFAPDCYVKAIHEAESAGYGVIVIDSLSHAWAGKDGALEMVDSAIARAGGGGANKFAAWRHVTPSHNALVDAQLQSKCHIVSTLRTKVEYVQEKDDRGRTTIRKVGLAPIQRDGLEYEYTVVGDMDSEHTLVISKSRCSALADKVMRKPGADLAKILIDWLSDGEPEAEKPTAKPEFKAPTPKAAAPVSVGTTTSADPMVNTPPADAEYASDVQSELSEARTTDDVVAVYKKYKAILSSEGETGLRALCAARKAEIQQAA